jgi:photosystem I P700 chlorophyll a apoprotein A2
MATKFPKFKAAQDPATRRIWYGIATAHEAHDGMTEENLYQKIFASHFGHKPLSFMDCRKSISCRLANFETWVTNPLK